MEMICITRIAFIITTKCTLTCPHCLHLNSKYKHRVFFDKAKLSDDISRLTGAVDRINGIHVMGGEALLHPELPGIIKMLLSEKKINHVGLTTNGTILPGSELLNTFKHPKAEVFLSNYPSVPTTKKWAALLEENNISYHVADNEKDWVDAGGLDVRSRTTDELRMMYSHCLYRECITLLDGRLFTCPRNANAVNQGIIPFALSNGVDLRVENAETMRKKIGHMLYDTGYLTCCDRCDFGLPDNQKKYICRAT